MYKTSLNSIQLTNTTNESSDFTNFSNTNENDILNSLMHNYYSMKRQDDTKSYSSNSLEVNIDDLADAEELTKISRILSLYHRDNDFNSCNEDKSKNLIENLHILNGFRLHSKEILDFLNTNEIKPNLHNYGERDTGRKLLSIAVEVDWYEGVIYLLNRDVNINETDKENRTALMHCLSSTNTNIILALVKTRQCNLDIQSITGHTAIHYSVMMNKIPFFDILIKSGARLDLCNDKGEHVLHEIILYRRKKCWKILKSFYKYRTNGFIYLKYLIHSETYENKNCLTLAFEHWPNTFFLKQLLPYSDKTKVNVEFYRSWPKAYKLVRNLLFNKKK